jgi:hypothetical protein
VIATRRRYRNDTLILETEWVTPEGSVRVIDYMLPRGEAADVVRLVEGLSGTVPMRMDLRLRSTTAVSCRGCAATSRISARSPVRTPSGCVPT